jgi:hypothetical protein
MQHLSIALGLGLVLPGVAASQIPAPTATPAPAMGKCQAPPKNFSLTVGNGDGDCIFLAPPSHSNISVAGHAAKDLSGMRKDGDHMAAGADFENITSGMIVTVRHKASGLVCKAPVAVIMSPSTEIEALDPVGQSSCVSRVSSFQNDLVVLPNSGNLTVDEALRRLIARTKYVQPEMTSLSRTADSSSTYLTASSAPDSDSGADYTRLSIAIVDGWIVYDKIMGPAAERVTGDTISDRSIAEAIRDIARTRTPPAR